MYYFRWWTFRKHISETPQGFVVSEVSPSALWAGESNTISCSSARHFHEGRWPRDRKYLADYEWFWFRQAGNPRLYSFAVADALRAWSLATQDQYLAADLLPALLADCQAREKAHQDPNGLFWQNHDRDEWNSPSGEDLGFTYWYIPKREIYE